MADVLRTALVAFAIVMAGMVLLTLMSAALRRLVVSGGTEPETPAAAADPVLLAVLTAAASEAIGRAVRVRRVQVRRAPESERWSRAGRMDLMVSHRVGPRR
jgi:hypothetical protein